MNNLLAYRTVIYLFIFLCSMLCFTNSCSNHTEANKGKPFYSKDDTKNLLSLRIQYPAGSLLPESILKSKVPTLFNVGRLSENVYGMLLGPSLSTKARYSYEPIGVYTLLKDSVELSFILCKSDQLESELIDADSYNSWSLNEIQYKNLIASWFKTNCELNHCSKMEWANDLKALRILENVN